MPAASLCQNSGGSGGIHLPPSNRLLPLATHGNHDAIMARANAEFPLEDKWAALEQDWKDKLTALSNYRREVEDAVYHLKGDPRSQVNAEAYKRRREAFLRHLDEVRDKVTDSAREAADTEDEVEAVAKFRVVNVLNTILDATQAAVRDAEWIDVEDMQHKFKIALNIPVVDVKHTPLNVSGTAFKGNIKYNQLKDLCAGYDGVKHPLIPSEFLRRYEQSLTLSTSTQEAIPDEVKISTIRLLLSKNALMWHDNQRRRADNEYPDAVDMMKAWKSYQVAFLKEFKSRVTFAEQQKIKARLASDAKNLTDRSLLNACTEAALAIMAEKPTGETFRAERDNTTVDLFVAHCDALIRSKISNLAAGRQIDLKDVHAAIEQAELQRELAKSSQARSSVLLAELEENDGVFAVQPGRQRGTRPVQGTDCFFCKKSGHQKWQCRSFESKHPEQFKTYNQRRANLQAARAQRGQRASGNNPRPQFPNKTGTPFQANAVELDDTNKDERPAENTGEEVSTVATVSHDTNVNFDGVVHQLFTHRPGPMSSL